MPTLVDTSLPTGLTENVCSDELMYVHFFEAGAAEYFQIIAQTRCCLYNILKQGSKFLSFSMTGMQLQNSVHIASLTVQ